MSLNHIGTSNTKPYISANVNSITANTLLVRVNPSHEGNISFQEYVPSVIEPDTPFDFSITDAKFLYKQISAGAEMQLHIIFSAKCFMTNTSGSQRGLIFSLPPGITTTDTVGEVANGYMVGEAPVSLTTFKTHIIKEVTLPSIDQVRVVFANPNSTNYTNMYYDFRGEIVLRIF